MSLDEKKQITRWLISLGIFAVLMGVGFYAARPYIDARRSVQTHLIARDIISEHLSSATENLGVIEMAIRYQVLDKGNDLLAACLEKDDAREPCSITSPELQTQFILKDSIYETGKILAGTSDSPGVYSLSGKNACDQAADKDCPGWIAHIWFWAECPEKAASCDKAERIWIRHQVTSVSTSENLPPHPPTEQFEVDLTSFAHSLRLQTQ